jgi:hypothetical protein
MAIKNVFTIVLDGDKGWVNGAEMNAEQLKEMRESNYAGWVSTLLPLKDKAFTLSSLAETTVGGKPAVGVKVSHQGHRDVKLYFDKESGLLAKVISRVKAEEMDGKEVDQETEQQQYKDFGGIKVPKRIVIRRDGKRFVEANIRDWKGAEKLDNSVFKP